MIGFCNNERYACFIFLKAYRTVLRATSDRSSKSTIYRFIYFLFSLLCYSQARDISRRRIHHARSRAKWGESFDVSIRYYQFETLRILLFRICSSHFKMGIISEARPVNVALLKLSYRILGKSWTASRSKSYRRDRNNDLFSPRS